MVSHQQSFALRHIIHLEDSEWSGQQLSGRAFQVDGTGVSPSHVAVGTNPTLALCVEFE